MQQLPATHSYEEAVDLNHTPMLVYIEYGYRKNVIARERTMIGDYIHEYLSTRGWSKAKKRLAYHPFISTHGANAVMDDLFTSLKDSRGVNYLRFVRLFAVLPYPTATTWTGTTLSPALGIRVASALPLITE